jgi:thiamine-phosphate pyrophosphorylase
MQYELYVVTDRTIGRGRSHGIQAAAALEGGADVIQLRDKDMSGRELLITAREICKLTEETGALSIINDRLDVALAAKASGVHLGQSDLPVGAAKAIAPSGFIIGVSVATLEEAQQAEREGADYVALSPVFDTRTKNDAGPGHGLAILRTMRRELNVPVLAIGGIGLNNVRDVFNAGADGVAVISAVIGKDDIAAATADLKSHIREIRHHSDERPKPTFE